MNKQEAVVQLNKLVEEFQTKLEELEAFASEHDIELNLNILDQNHTYIPAGHGRPTIQDYWDEDYNEDELNENDWDGQFSGWQNSSTFC